MDANIFRPIRFLAFGLALLFGTASLAAPALHAQWAPQSTEDIRTLTYRRDIHAFAADLQRAGLRDSVRALNYAYFAVTEAYRYELPPSLLFGVMLKENPDFIPWATNRASGATGLMQVMPQVWVPQLALRFGTELRDPEVNVRYGAYVLAYFAKRHRGDWFATLTGYSGRATNYPQGVMQLIRRYGVALCGNHSLDTCTGKPLYQRYALGSFASSY